MSEQTIRKSSAPAIIKKAKDERRYTFVVSSEAPDRVNDVIVQSGLKADSDYIPAQIDHSGKFLDRIGTWSDLRKTVIDGVPATLMDLIPFEKGVSQVADLVTALLDSKEKLAASIGFKGEGQLRDPKKGYSGGMVYKTATLMECSIVTVPCHQNALSIAKSLNMPKSVINKVFQTDEDIKIMFDMKKHDVLMRAKLLLKK